MPLNHRDPAALTTRLMSDHQAHMHSLAKTLASAIAARLNDRTKQLDPRSSARAKVVGMESYKVPNGGSGIKIKVVQSINDDVIDTKKTQIRQQQSAVVSQAVTKAGAVTLLSSKGVT